MAVLGGVAAGGVDQHRFVGEPPIAVAGAADAAEGVFAVTVSQGEVQAGVHQCGGFAGTGWADDDVPGQLVQRDAAIGTVEFGFLEDRHAIGKALAQGLDFLAGFFGVRVDGRLGQFAGQALVAAMGQQHADQLCDQPDQQDAENEHQSHRGGQGGVVCTEFDEVGAKPDDQCEGEDAQQPQEDFIGQNCH